MGAVRIFGTPTSNHMRLESILPPSQCQPGDLLVYEPDEEEEGAPVAG